MTKIKKVFRTIAGDRQLLFGCLGLMILLLVILFQGVLETHDPYEYGSDSLVGLGVNGHLLGTNKLGQDIFSMLIAGVSTSLKVALISSMISAIIGILMTTFLATLGGVVMPVLLSVAAGAMIFIVVEELIPESQSGDHGHAATYGFLLGFWLMALLGVLGG